MHNRYPLAIAFTLLALLASAPMASAQVCVAHVHDCVVPGGAVIETCWSNDHTVGFIPHVNCKFPWDSRLVGDRCADAAGNLCCACFTTWPPRPIACDPQVIDSATLQIFVQSADGLTSITPVQVVNATLATYGFSPATTDAVQVVASKIDTSQSARVVLQVCDTVECITCDPIITLVIRETGKPVRESLANVPQAESKITVHNGAPGLRNILVTVNGETFRMNGLKDGEERTIDATSAMLPGETNSIAMTATGKPGGEATVIIHD